MMITDEDIEEYHARTDVSSSKLRSFIKAGPRAYQILYVLRKIKQKTTAAMKKGNDFEDALCGRREIAYVPDGMKLSTKAGIAWKQENEGAIIVSNSDRSLYEYGLQHLRELGEWSLVEGAVEQPTFRSEFAGLPGIQSRPDWYHVEKGTMIDLKTTESLDRFRFSVEDFLYHVQADLFRRASGYEKTAHVLIVCEKRFPHRCRAVWLNEEYLNLGRAICDRYLEKLAKCYASDLWPLVEIDSITLGPPPGAFGSELLLDS